MYHPLLDYSKKTEDELIELAYQTRKRILHAQQYNQMMLLDQLHLTLEMIENELAEKERVKQEAREKKEKKNKSDTITLGDIDDNGPQDVYDFKF